MDTNSKEGHGVYKGRIYIPLILKMKNILCLDLTETGLIHCTSGKVTGYYISVSQLIIQIINCLIYLIYQMMIASK